MLIKYWKYTFNSSRVEKVQQMTPDESAVDYSVTTLQSTSTSDNIPMDNPSNNSALTAILTHQGNTNVLYSRATLV
jgi:hypothetical protein